MAKNEVPTKVIQEEQEVAVLVHPAIVSLAIVWALFAPPVAAWFYLRFVGRIMLAKLER